MLLSPALAGTGRWNRLAQPAKGRRSHIARDRPLLIGTVPARCCIQDYEPAVCAVLASSLLARVAQCRPLPRSQGIWCGSQCLRRRRTLAIRFLAGDEPLAMPTHAATTGPNLQSLARVPAVAGRTAMPAPVVAGRWVAAWQGACSGLSVVVGDGGPGSRRLALSVSRQRSLLAAGLSSAPCLSWEVGTWGRSAAAIHG